MEEWKEISEYLTEAYEKTSKLVQKREVSGNSLEERFRLTLEEKERYLSSLLTRIENESLEKKEVNHELFIIYHADEVGNIHLGGWKREVTWTDAPEKETVEGFSDTSKEIKQLLVNATSSLEKVLGEEDYKFVIPALYRT